MKTKETQKIRITVLKEGSNKNFVFSKKIKQYLSVVFATALLLTTVFSYTDSQTAKAEIFDPQATVKVIKHVVNAHGGTKIASDFTMKVSNAPDLPGSSVVTATFPGDEAGTDTTVYEGIFSAGETTVAGYAMTKEGDCSGHILEGEIKVCTITNTDIPANLNVVVQVLNDNSGSKVPGDFNVVITEGIANPGSFPGDESGTEVVMHSGAFKVEVDPDSNYDITYSPECEGSLALAESLTCTININDIEQTGGGGTGGDGEDEEETPPPGDGGGSSGGGGAGGPAPSSGGGGTSSGGSGIPTPPSAASGDVGEVLGVSTTNVPSIPMPADGGTEPEGKVLGASTELPRTGTNSLTVIVSLLAGLLVFVPKPKLKFK